MKGPEKSQEKSGTRAAREVQFAALVSFDGGILGMGRTNTVRRLCVEPQPLRKSGKAKNHDGQNFDWMVGNTG